jgi:membrane-anchored glycerophosphoryl diester phosphodiesterase (GDPDase)
MPQFAQHTSASANPAATPSSVALLMVWYLFLTVLLAYLNFSFCFNEEEARRK